MRYFLDIMAEKHDSLIDLSDNDLKEYLRILLHSRSSLVDFVIEGFNNLGASMRDMVIRQFAISHPPFKNIRTTDDNKDIENISFDVTFENLDVKQPTIVDPNTGQNIPKYPWESRVSFTNYTSPIYLSLKAVFKAYDINGKVIKERVLTLNDKEITTIPIIIRSNMCQTGHIKDLPNQLINCLESPEDPGGYLIMSGNEIYIVNSENVKYNSPNIYFTTNPTLPDICWLEMISKPGDAFENSQQIVVRFSKDGAIYVQIDALLKDENIPFYLVFRMFGITNDRDIVKFIIHDAIESNDKITKDLQSIIQKAYMSSSTKLFPKNEYSQQEILKYISKINLMVTQTEESDEVANIYVADISKKMDKLVLPHIGETQQYRYSKARFLGLLIRKLLLVYNKIIPPTDRDSYVNKRIHSAGPSLAKIFKTHFNISVVQKIRKDLRAAFDSTDFSNVRLESFKLDKERLEKALLQSLTSSLDTIKIGTRVIPNRIMSVPVHRKNQLNTIVSARNIEMPASSSKATSRAEEMREVQAMSRFYTCPIATKDTGEKVGMTKEMTITSYITPIQTGMSLRFKELISKDLLQLNNVRPEDYNKYAKVFVNGDWLGFNEHPHILVAKYREKRRTGEIDRYITIYWDNVYDEIYFWLDHGRLVCPFIIMDNNYNEVFAAELEGRQIEFVQAPRLKPQHVKWLKEGRRDNQDYKIENLIREGIIEYIAPEEMLNCFMAENLDIVRENKNNIEKVFTHLEIAAAAYGLSAHQGILLNHNPPTRSAYETNQSKQTNGIAPLGWPFRMDKLMAYQIRTESPLVRTIINDILMPNGLNAQVAYMCLDGKNQEDSIETDKSAIDRGWFWAAFWRNTQSEIKQNEIIRRPNFNDTINIKRDSLYSKLNENGFIAPGTMVKNDDIIICKLAVLHDKDRDTRDARFEKIKYADKSISYKCDDAGYVEKITKPAIKVKSDGTKFVAVKTVSELPVCVGDKFSSRAGNKSINAASLWAGDMPFTASGTPISIISNAQTITSRMVTSQLMEGIIAKVCALQGLFRDGTAYTKINIDQLRIQAAKLGIQNVGLEQVYNGKTGEAVDTLIAIYPTFMQRLQKFAEHEIYSNQYGPTDAINHQPTSGGRATSGGARWGEMEKDVQTAQNAMNTLGEFFFDKSDGVIIYFCRKCGRRATRNNQDDTYICKTKDCTGDIVRTNSSYSANLFLNEQFAMGVNTKLATDQFTYYKNE